MRKFVFVSVLISLGCSGGSSKKDGTVDPASLDFCLEWANGVCRLAYLCTDAAAQDATFQARFGTSADTCWEVVEKRCTSNQSGSQTFGPSCGAGKTVNTTAATACNDGLETAACTAWRAAPSGAGCDGVCSTASSTGGTSAGGASGTGGMGASTGGTGASTGGMGSIATSAQYCLALGNLSCDRRFECDPAVAAENFGTIANCKTLLNSICASDEFCPNGYDSALGATCLAAAKTASCQELMGEGPAACSNACP